MMREASTSLVFSHYSQARAEDAPNWFRRAATRQHRGMETCVGSVIAPKNMGMP